MEEERDCFLKNINLTSYSQKGLKLLPGEKDGQRQGQTKTYCYIDRYLILLTIARSVIFKTPLSTSSAPWPGTLN